MIAIIFRRSLVKGKQVAFLLCVLAFWFSLLNISIFYQGMSVKKKYIKFKLQKTYIFDGQVVMLIQGIHYNYWNIPN